MTKAVVNPLEAHLGYWLRYVSNHVSHTFALKVEARGVTVAEWVVLRELFDKEADAPSTLAKRLGMTRGAITKLADRLIAKSLLTRTATKNDRRYQALALTAAGRALVPKLAALADQNDQEFFGHMDATEQKSFETTLKTIIRQHGLKTIPVE